MEEMKTITVICVTDDKKVKYELYIYSFCIYTES